MKTTCYVLMLLLIGAWSAEAAILCARKDREGNASGSPFIHIVPGSSTFLLPLSVIKGPGRTVYLADTSVPSRNISAKSQWLEPDSSILPFGACNPISSTEEVWPATAVVDLSTMFVPPFSVR